MIATRGPTSVRDFRRGTRQDFYLNAPVQDVIKVVDELVRSKEQQPIEIRTSGSPDLVSSSQPAGALRALFPCC